MNKRLEKAIKEFKFADYDFLAKSDEKTVEKAKKVLGYNMPSQLEEWLRVYNGGAIAGIVIGTLLLAGIGGFAIFWFAVKKKTFADLGAALKKGFTAIGNFFKSLGEKIKAKFNKKK